MTVFRRILVPLDGSAAGETILEHVALVAEPATPIDLVHVLPPPLPASRPHDDVEDVRAYLGDVRRRMGDPTGDDVVLPAGASADAASAILEAAGRNGSDLIALCTHAREGMDRLILGSVADTIVKRSAVPVLLVRPGVRAPHRKLHLVLVPIDDTEESELILRTAGPLAARKGAQLVVIHVMAEELEPVPRLSFFPNSGRRLQRIAARLEESGLTAWSKIAHGVPDVEIASAADALGAELIAMATRGWGGLGRSMLGSVTEAVLRRAACAVLLRRS